MKQGDDMPDRVPDVMITATAGSAVTMPWWYTALPDLIAPAVAVIGGMVLLVTLYIKIKQAQLVRMKVQLALDEGE
jgi:hypothetical protein